MVGHPGSKKGWVFTDCPFIAHWSRQQGAKSRVRYKPSLLIALFLQNYTKNSLICNFQIQSPTTSTPSCTYFIHPTRLTRLNRLSNLTLYPHCAIKMQEYGINAPLKFAKIDLYWGGVTGWEHPSTMQNMWRLVQTTFVSRRKSLGSVKNSFAPLRTCSAASER